MSKLRCNVSSCCHHDGSLCRLNQIMIEGPGACRKDQTCCFSFCDQSASQNNVMSNSFSQEETDIGCKAENCKHNRRMYCSANDVTVGSMTSSPNVTGETECCTFCAR